MSWESYFRLLSNTIKLKSKDKNTQIGVVIVGEDNEIISTGYNSFPRGIDDALDYRQERPEKYYWFEHAERNAIFNAARIGVSTKGATMYLSCGIPCSDCARAIINSGITEIVCEENDVTKSSHWLDHQKRSLIMFKETNVKIRFYTD